MRLVIPTKSAAEVVEAFVPNALFFLDSALAATWLSSRAAQTARFTSHAFEKTFVRSLASARDDKSARGAGMPVFAN